MLILCSMAFIQCYFLLYGSDSALRIYVLPSHRYYSGLFIVGLLPGGRHFSVLTSVSVKEWGVVQGGTTPQMLTGLSEIIMCYSL